MTSCAPATTRKTQGTGRGLSRWLYYLSSIPTLLARVRDWPRVLRIFLGPPPAAPTTIELANGCRFRVRTRMDVWIIKETCLDRDYERAVTIENGWTVFDIGAGLGDFAVSVARERPDSTIYAFEPNPESFALLQENIALNGLGNVRAFPEAVVGRSGTAKLYTRTGLSGQHRTATAAAEEPTGAIAVPAVALAEAIARLPARRRCDFLKIDCEGAEFEILLSAGEPTLAAIGHIAMEYHDGITAHSHGELVALLERLGFEVRTRPNPVYRELGFLYASRPRRKGGQS